MTRALQEGAMKDHHWPAWSWSDAWRLESGMIPPTLNLAVKNESIRHINDHKLINACCEQTKTFQLSMIQFRRDWMIDGLDERIWGLCLRNIWIAASMYGSESNDCALFIGPMNTRNGHGMNRVLNGNLNLSQGGWVCFRVWNWLRF